MYQQWPNLKKLYYVIYIFPDIRVNNRIQIWVSTVQNIPVLVLSCTDLIRVQW
jgi:hypothetical protein